MSPRWISYVVSKPPREGVLKNAVSKILAISCDNSETVRDMILISNRKSHTGFRLVPTSMTLNDLERRNSPYFAFFSPNSIALQADYITVVEDRPIMSVKYCILVLVFHFRPKLTYPAARFVCDSWASCGRYYKKHFGLVFSWTQCVI